MGEEGREKLLGRRGGEREDTRGKVQEVKRTRVRKKGI